MGAKQSKENGGGVTAEDWRQALDKVVPAVVVLRTTVPRNFDTEITGSYSATGFVVDKDRGIILTNRHVVQPGPVVAEAVFVNREEVPVYPIYRDPVHDFGFFRYDPSAIQFLSYNEIPLVPEAACVGLEIRVVGNDSGEKVSILSGTLARLDRDAPVYKRNGYNDFNTFYLQAASGTKSGSSGSPVIDWQGRAVALNAGNMVDGTSAYYLPLERVVRALKLLQRGRASSINDWEAVTIPRGTLQATFLHKGFEETRRLGIRSETENLVRHASPSGETGMLVVGSVVPHGPAYRYLEPGDVLVRLNGEVTTRFLKMENLLDDSVDRRVELQIERSGKPLTVSLMVMNLHSVTPDFFLEISGAVIHPLSYQQAINFCLPCGLAYVAEQGCILNKAGVPSESIIRKFAGEDIYSVEDFIYALSKLTRGARVPLEYTIHNDRHRTKSVLVAIDFHEWYGPPQIYTRNDSSGLWTVKPALPSSSSLLSSRLVNGTSSSGPTVSPMAKIHQSVGLEHMDNNSLNSTGSPGIKLAEGPPVVDESISGTIPQKIMEDKLEDSGDCSATNTSIAERVVEPSLVMLEVYVPLSCGVDGLHALCFIGTGVIIYHSPSLGLVAIDRNTTVVSSSDVMLSFAAYPMEIPGEVVFLHPTHNFALVSYDPSALGPGASVVRRAELLPEPALCRGDSVYLVGLGLNLHVTSRKSIITNASNALHVGTDKNPRYRATSTDLIELDADFGRTFTGVLTDKLGRVRALWGSFSLCNSSSPHSEFVGGIPIYIISQILDKITSGTNGPCRLINDMKRPMPFVRILEVELLPILLSKARTFGLSDAWIQVLIEKDPRRRQVLRVVGCLAGSHAEYSLRQGDMVLAINGKPTTCFRDIEDACQDIERDNDNNGMLTLTIFRQGNEMDIDVETDLRDGNGTTRVVGWCGAVLQAPHPAVRALGYLPVEGNGVYVARWYHGSPVERYGVFACQWIVKVNDIPTPDLDVFIAVTKELGHGEFVQIQTVDLEAKLRVFTLKQDLHYWPTWEVRFDPETGMWRRRTIKALHNGAQ